MNPAPQSSDPTVLTLRTLPEHPLQVCVFLLQLGGPTTLEAIQPFLRALFEDVLPLPNLIRKPLARYIAWRRAPQVKPNYELLGGGSPLQKNTQAQQTALAEVLTQMGIAAQIYIVMRYTAPRCLDALNHARTVLPQGPWIPLSLYPHYSFATSRSSLREFWQALTPPERSISRAVCAYPIHPQFIEAVVDTIKTTTAKVSPEIQRELHYVFSAHGLPVKLVKEGDPYPQHIEQTVAAVCQELKLRPEQFTLCYQSKVGRAAWLTPSTEHTIEDLGKRGMAHLIVIPIAFTSEHIETLHELDLELKETAHQVGITTYLRAPTVGASKLYMQCLASLIQARQTGVFCCGLVPDCELGRQGAHPGTAAQAPTP